MYVFVSRLNVTHFYCAKCEYFMVDDFNKHFTYDKDYTDC